MQYAIVNAGLVHEIYAQRPDMHPDIITEVEDTVEVGMARQANGSFAFPVPSPEQINAAIDAQIIALESKQARPLREVALGMAGALERISALDEQIAALRARRV